ncbi:MAG: hypothetical protein MZV70_02730 [Desulfobacterales bacterium]|nr:hypothetical protein [Desulfobacterales bacterium]
MGMAALPALSEHAAKGDLDRLKEDFSFSLRLLFFITVPAMVGLIALRVPIVSTLFQRGLFGPGRTIGIGCPDVLLHRDMGDRRRQDHHGRILFLQDTKTPVKVAFAAVMINIALSPLVLMGPLKHNGLALETALPHASISRCSSSSCAGDSGISARGESSRPSQRLPAPRLSWASPAGLW